MGSVCYWARGNGLEILLLVLGSVLLASFVHFVADKAGDVTERLEARRAGVSVGPDSQARYAKALVQAGEWVAVSLIYFVASLLVFSRIGIPLTTLVAPATALGAGLGFGTQRIVQDLLAGLFLFTERQFGVGDVVRISQLGSVTGTNGTVEELTLRVTKRRGTQGELIIIPNGQLIQVTNLSRGFGRVMVDLPVAMGEDVEMALNVLREVADAMYADEHWRSILLSPPVVTGVEAIQVGYAVLRIQAKTPSEQQWGVGRELRARSIQALRDKGVETPTLATGIAAASAPGPLS